MPLLASSWLQLPSPQCTLVPQAHLDLMLPTAVVLPVLLSVPGVATTGVLALIPHSLVEVLANAAALSAATVEVLGTLPKSPVQLAALAMPVGPSGSRSRGCCPVRRKKTRHGAAAVRPAVVRPAVAVLEPAVAVPKPAVAVAVAAVLGPGPLLPLAW